MNDKKWRKGKETLKDLKKIETDSEENKIVMQLALMYGKSQKNIQQFERWKMRIP